VSNAVNTPRTGLAPEKVARAHRQPPVGRYLVIERW
jgi:hypothetical protein